MSKPKRLQSGDIPQADRLATVRQVIREVSVGNMTVAGISQATGVTQRHVQYRTQTARILALIDSQNALMPLGRELLEFPEGTPEENAFWCRVISTCLTVKNLAPNLLGPEEIDRSKLASRIETATGLARKTAERRMTTLCSWRRQLIPKTIET